jgi:Ca-activated chloride channel family protein
MALLIVGLARPRTVEANARVTTEGIDIVLALDISGSMRDPGLDAPSKIDAAKQALKKFLDERTDDRVGFVVFRSEARVLSPLSTDYKALQQIVDQADKNQPLDEGTGIGVGLSTALNVLRESHARSRVIILATDGEENAHTIEPEQAGKIAETLKVRLYTIGIPTTGTRADLSLNEKQMRTIAEGTGGSYARASNQKGLEDIFTNITTLEKDRIERERFTRYNELAPWLLVPALALVVLETLLGATVFRRAP